MAYHLWAALLPCAWSHIAPEQREIIHKGCVQLLGKDYHAVQRFIQPNVVQALLHSLSRCQSVSSSSLPMLSDLHNPYLIYAGGQIPDMPGELIKYLGKTFNVWHLASSFLEALVSRPSSPTPSLPSGSQVPFAFSRLPNCRRRS